MDYVVVRHRFTEGLCATGVRLRSPVLFLFLGAIRIEATGGTKLPPVAPTFLAVMQKYACF